MGTEKNAAAAKANYRQIIHFDKKNCPTKILNALHDKQITMDVMDKDKNVMHVEAAYMDMDKTCWSTRRGLYFQVHRRYSDSKQEDVLNGAGTRDMYFVAIDGVAPHELAALEIEEADLRNCFTKAMVHRFDDSGRPEDLTKCFHYTQCNNNGGKPIDWGTASTEAPTEAPTPSPTGPTIPDFNNDDYTVSCGQTNGMDTCTITMSDGTSFTGELKNGVVIFKKIPYALPPIGDLRWKSTVPKFSFDSPVDATQYGPACATINNKEGESEDCLFLNIQVKKSVLENKEKKPIVFFIHGGGHNNGNNHGYNFNMVNNQDIVYASVAYRLGPYGFLHMEEKEADQQWGGHWAYQDQIAALQFLHAFGGVFGGNKDNISLTGGSAGSEAAWRHLTTEQSWPWFNKVAPAGSPIVAGSFTSGKHNQKLVSAFFDAAGCDLYDLNCMRQLSTAEASAAALQSSSVVREDNVSMAFNGAFAPVHYTDWFRSTLFQDVHDGHIKPNTPVLQTWARDEPWGAGANLLTQQAKSGCLLFDVAQELKAAQDQTGSRAPKQYLSL